MPRMTLRGRQTVAAIMILVTLGTAAAVILSRDFELEMTEAVRAGDLTKVQELLCEDPALSRAKVMRTRGNRRNDLTAQRASAFGLLPLQTRYPVENVNGVLRIGLAIGCARCARAHAPDIPQ